MTSPGLDLHRKHMAEQGGQVLSHIAVKAIANASRVGIASIASCCAVRCTHAEKRALKTPRMSAVIRHLSHPTGAVLFEEATTLTPVFPVNQAGVSERPNIRQVAWEQRAQMAGCPGRRQKAIAAAAVLLI